MTEQEVQTKFYELQNRHRQMRSLHKEVLGGYWGDVRSNSRCHALIQDDFLETNRVDQMFRHVNETRFQILRGLEEILKETISPILSMDIKREIQTLKTTFPRF